MAGSGKSGATGCGEGGTGSARLVSMEAVTRGCSARSGLCGCTRSGRADGDKRGGGCAGVSWHSSSSRVGTGDGYTRRGM